MKTYAEYNEPMPDYSLSYLINGDDSGITAGDKIIIDNYMQEYYDLASKVNGHVVIGLDSDEPYFTWRPAFWLACNVYDCNIVILVSD